MISDDDGNDDEARPEFVRSSAPSPKALHDDNGDSDVETMSISVIVMD
jgi:hypothetical protein